MERYIKNYPNYTITEEGVVTNKETGRILKATNLSYRNPMVSLVDHSGRRCSRSVDKLIKETFPELFEITPSAQIIYHKEGSLINSPLTEEQLEIRKYFIYDYTKDNHLKNISTGIRAGGTWEDIGYAYVTYKGIQCAEHSLILLYMLGNSFTERDYEVDHIDHIRDNNSWNNLRVVNRVANARNLSKHKSNTSGHTGVSWHKTKNKWRAHIMVDYKQIHLGLFSSLDEAVEARRLANLKYNFHLNHGK